MSTTRERNSKVIEKGIQDAFTLKANKGEEPQEICNKLSRQIYNFIAKTPNFANNNISRGIRGIFVEKNREAIIKSVLNTYLKYISSNSKFQNENDIYIKGQLEKNKNINEIVQIILNSKEMIGRIRTNNC